VQEFHAALHGTPVHFCQAKLLFSCPNAVPLYRLLLKNELTKAMRLVYEMLCTSLYIPPADRNIITNTCDMRSNVHITFPIFSYSCQKKKKNRTYSYVAG
jgi:hypothetical protein